MYGKLNIRILSAMALILGVIMAALNLYPSWLQTAGTVHDPMLYSTLFCISMTFMIGSFTIPVKEITKIFRISFTLNQCFRIVSYMFGGVMIFSVNSSYKLIEYAHLAFTGLGIVVGYIGLLTYPSTKKGHTWAFIGTMFGVIGFLGGFVLKLYSTSWGEVFAALPLCIFINLIISEKWQIKEKGVNGWFYCQRDIEGESMCDSSCEHCEEYYGPLNKHNERN